MAKIFITGSADGLGLMTAKLLLSQGHEVVLHARNAERKKQTMMKVPGAAAVLTGELSDMDETKNLAAEVNARGKFDAVIHNAGVYRVSDKLIFTVNSLAPYILTCLIQKPERLIYLSSGMHLHGQTGFKNLSLAKGCSYSDSKLHVLLLCKAAARKWPDIYANALDPGWVPTKMGGASAPDNLEKGFITQAWLAVSNEAAAKVSGRYFFHQKESRYNPAADDINAQEKFLSLCEQITGIKFPAGRGF